MRHPHRPAFRHQVNFLRRQFLQDADLPFTNILTEDPSQVRIGAEVEAVVERGEGAPPVLRFRLGA